MSGQTLHETGDENYIVTVCQGPPRCDLTGQEAIDAKIAGCPWCERITIAPDGSERVERPGEC